jgi:N-acetylneuraminic acid mutarotase
MFDINTRRWTELECIGYIPAPREGHAAALVDDVMYVFGGRGIDGKDLGDLTAFKFSCKYACPSDQYCILTFGASATLVQIHEHGANA